MMPCPFSRAAPRLAALLCLAATAPAIAQGDTTRVAPPTFHQLIGTPQADRQRMSQLSGGGIVRMSLIQSASANADTTPLPWNRHQLGIIHPRVDLTWNSQIPFSLNDGPQWAGRGVTATVAGGVHARVGRVSATLAPAIWHAQNRPTVVLPSGDPLRRGFANPWHFGTLSADLPLRFGHAPTTAIDLGESAVWYTARGVAAGLSNESQWWGPGIRNALVMSNNAGGFPHAFVRTAAPMRVPHGSIEARWLVGGLLESRFFDTHTANDLRSLSGAVVTFTPSLDSGLTAGIARVVYSAVPGPGALPARAFDVIFRWGEGSSVRSARYGRAAEQLTTLFGRWAFPESGAEVYGEWARMILPASLRSLLAAPQYSQGFTLGTQLVIRSAREPRYRVQLEFTNLEQSPKSKAQNTVSFYTSAVVPQGYTHRGQVLGAAIGPGSSSQWIALDRIGRAFDVGVMAGRIRWDTDAYYTQTTSIYYLSYDASVYSGVRAASRAFGREIAGEILWQRRYNYLFQNALEGWSQDPVFDKSNVTVRLRYH